MNTKNVCLALIGFTLLVGCTRNAITGRTQLKLIPESEVQSMALNEYKTFLTSNIVVSTTASKDAEMVKRVGTRIANAITQYYTSQGQGDVLKGYQWEFNLVESKEVNAWCMPGGKVVVYTGLLPVTQNEAALAVVLAHEITHAVADHGNERMSRDYIYQFGDVALSVALAQKPAETQALFKSAYGVGTQTAGMLPFSRKQELEADHFGLIFCAMAGYNPNEAVAFWQRMAGLSGTGNTPEFLSDHPSDATRIDKIKNEYLSDALKYYRPVR